MEKTQTDAPETAEIETPPEPALWELTEDNGALSATDPEGWWSAKVVGEIVSITRYANHSLLNRPAGQTDSADQTIVAPLGELIDRLIELDEHYSPGPSEMDLDLDAIAEARGLELVEKAAIDALYSQRDELGNDVSAIRNALGIEEDVNVLEAIAELRESATIHPDPATLTTEEIVLNDAPEIDPTPVVDPVPAEPARTETPKAAIGKGKKEAPAGA